jgi:uncharacterized protein (UPF0332 family)
MLHRIFEARQEVDYKEFVEFSHDEAKEAVKSAGEFVRAVKALPIA